MLLHICCAPCTIFPLKTLREQGIDPLGYFYNPNIHPFREYEKRLTTLQTFSRTSGLEVIYNDRYDLELFLNRTSPWGADRCKACYILRLESAAREAGNRNMEAFSTTLLYSRYQKHDLIREIGMEMGTRYGITFYYQDFRHGWFEGIKESKELGLYRQPYCGCIFSEKERYVKKRSEV